MTFARPTVLALAPLVLLWVAWAIFAQRKRALRLLAAYGGSAADRLAPRALGATPVVRLLAAATVTLAVVVGAAEPRPTIEEPVSQQPIDLVVALDISLSMSAEDADGSRARRASEVLAALTDAMPDEHIGVAVFADWPYTLVPLTHDLSVIRYFGDRLGPELVMDRDQGTGLGAVVTHARSALDARAREAAEPAILVISDGESYDEVGSVLDSVSTATQGGVRLYTGGIGTRAGGRLPIPGVPGEFVLDPTGSPVVARLDDDLLRQMAGVGGGRYHDLTDDAGVRALITDIVGEARQADTPDRGPEPVVWLCLLALVALVVEGSADNVYRWRRGASREVRT